jgi:hypothetical protein
VNVLLQETFVQLLLHTQDHDRYWKLHCDGVDHGAQDGRAIARPLNVPPLHRFPVDGY